MKPENTNPQEDWFEIESEQGCFRLTGPNTNALFANLNEAQLRKVLPRMEAYFYSKFRLDQFSEMLTLRKRREISRKLTIDWLYFININRISLFFVAPTLLLAKSHPDTWRIIRDQVESEYGERSQVSDQLISEILRMDVEKYKKWVESDDEFMSWR